MPDWAVAFLKAALLLSENEKNSSLKVASPRNIQLKFFVIVPL